MTSAAGAWSPVPILAASLIFGLPSDGHRMAAPQVVNSILVIVNGDILTRRQLDERVRSILAQQQGRAITAAEIRADATLVRQAAALAPKAAGDAIDELLILQRARDLGFESGEDEVNRVISTMRLDNHVDSEAAFADLLREQGIPPDAMRESIRAQILIEEVRQDVLRRIGVTDAEAEAYYQGHTGAFAQGPAVRYRELLVALPPVDTTHPSAAAPEYDRGLVTFVSAQDRIGRGEDFAVVARELSDAPSREAGGAVESIEHREPPELLRAALARLSPGQVSPPVRTDEGYWLLKLESVSPPRPSTFEANRAEVTAQLLAQKQARVFLDQLKQLRARALIEWKDPALKAAWERAVSGRG
jgi:peptidyl-prolyl cis-trans isomerase SurA